MIAEPVTLVELDRDVCSLTFGVSPCPATGPKCYNTWKTCSAREAFAVTTQTLRFAKPRADLPLSWDAIPSLVSTTTAPTELNVGDVDSSSGPLGKRAQATIVFQDHPTSDIQLDPYVADRAVSPWAYGSFWSKLKARWPYAKGRTVRIIDGQMPPTTYAVNNAVMPAAILRAATNQSPEKALFKETLISGRPLADIDNSGAVNSGDAFRYSAYINGTATAAEIAYIEGVMHPYMVSRPSVYGAYLIAAPDGEIVNPVSRTYLVDSIDGPDSKGRVTVKAVDPLRLLDDKTSQAPLQSRGELAADITAAQTTMTVTGAVLADYPASGTLRIDSELMTYTGRTESGGILTFTGLARGTDGSNASTHNIEDRVQTCLRYVDQNAVDVAASLIQTFAPSAYPFIDTTQWAAEKAAWLDGFIVSSVISEPTGLNTLLAELCRDAQFLIWWDERAQKIKLRAVRPPAELPVTWNEDAHILADSQSLQYKTDERISQVWYYYRPRDWSKKLDEATNYAKVRIRIDPTSESEREYGEAAVKKIYSRWVRTDAIVTAITARILTRYRDVPYYLTVSLDYKDSAAWTGDVVDVTSRLITNTEGIAIATRYQIISAQESSSNSVVKYLLQNYNFAAKYGFWMAADAPTYALATEEERMLGGWWADDDGLISGDAGYEWQ